MHARGALSNLAVRPQAPFASPLSGGDAEVGVRAVGLNFRDVLNVLGAYPGDPGMPGADCAGVVSDRGGALRSEHTRAGRSVLGVLVAPLASVARGDGRLLAPKAAALSFEQACACLLYTSPSPRDKRQSRMPSSA